MPFLNLALQGQQSLKKSGNRLECEQVGAHEYMCSKPPVGVPSISYGLILLLEEEGPLKHEMLRLLCPW